MRTLLITLASSLLLGSSQIGVQSVIMTGPGSSGPIYNACLVYGWPVNEGSGRTLHDVSVNANNATIATVSPTWGSNAGFPGSSWTVGSGGAGAANNTHANFDGTTPFSLAAWANVTSTSSNEIILSTLSNAGTYNGYEMSTEVVSAGKLEFYLSNSTSNRIIVTGSTTIAATGVHYLVATYDGSKNASGVKLYVDGAAETNNISQNNLTGTTTTASTPVLGERPADGNRMVGVLAAGVIYNCVLNPTDIATYFTRGVQVN